MKSYGGLAYLHVHIQLVIKSVSGLPCTHITLATTLKIFAVSIENKAEPSLEGYVARGRSSLCGQLLRFVGAQERNKEREQNKIK
jgi:hypothetical protein